MSTKLTLNIEKTVLDNARQYARQKGTSLSKMVESYLIIVNSESVFVEPELYTVVKSLRGSFKAPADYISERELSKSLSKKYLEDVKYSG